MWGQSTGQMKGVGSALWARLGPQIPCPLPSQKDRLSAHEAHVGAGLGFHCMQNLCGACPGWALHVVLTLAGLGLTLHVAPALYQAVWIPCAAWVLDQLEQAPHVAQLWANWVWHHV